MGYIPSHLEITMEKHIFASINVNKRGGQAWGKGDGGREHAVV